jgi:hypothetical protein
LKPTHEKVKAVKEAKAPESKEAVRSFLGMIVYLSKFIPISFIETRFTT